MDLQEPERKELPESVIPMINVVFLLLIFFLISATLTPPIDATPPVSAADSDRADPPELVIEKSGAIIFGEARGAEAIAAAAQIHDKTGDAPFALLADAEAPGPALARVIRELAKQGVRDVALTTLRETAAADCVAGSENKC